MADVTYVGTVQALVEKKSGWHTVEIAVPGKQYPVKADTKLEPLLKQVREVRDADLVATFTVSETESENINPNTSRPYTERRLQKVEPGVAEHAQSGQNATGSPTSGTQDGMSKEEWRRKDNAADKRALIAIAVSALQHTMPSDPSEEDLGKFLQRVARLSGSWHRVVIAERDDPNDEEVPF